MSDNTPLIDVFVPAAPGSLGRAALIDGLGRYRVSRRTCELFSVQIISSGAWGRFKIYNGKGRVLFDQKSTFTGSFVLGCEMQDGLIIEVHATTAPHLMINFREPDREMV